jgi:nucleoside-diphosphate-sugar epimerase
LRYVSDLIECLLRLACHASPAMPKVNAAACRAVSVRAVLTELFRIAGVDHPPVFLGRPKEGDPDRLVADDSAQDLLGPLFQMPLSEGLHAYVHWYRQRGTHVQGWIDTAPARDLAGRVELLP